MQNKKKKKKKKWKQGFHSGKRRKTPQQWPCYGSWERGSIPLHAITFWPNFTKGRMCYSAKDSSTYRSFYRQNSAVTLLLFSSCTQCFQLSKMKSGGFHKAGEAVFQFFGSGGSLKTVILSLEKFTLLGMISGHKFALLCLYMFPLLAQDIRANEQQFIV